jgi:hypothetical protein
MGIAKCYALEIPSVCVTVLAQPSRRGPYSNPPPHPLYKYYRVITGLKRSERVVDQPPLSNAQIKDKVQLYLCPPSGSS